MPNNFLSIKMNYFPVFLLIVLPFFTQAQQPAADSLLQQATLDNVVDYAIKHQPLIQQSLIDEQVTESLIKSKLADWYPQVDLRYNLQHNFQLQQAIIGGNIIKFGVEILRRRSSRLTRIFLTVMYYWPAARKAMYLAA